MITGPHSAGSRRHALVILESVVLLVSGVPDSRHGRRLDLSGQSFVRRVACAMVSN